MLDRAPDAAARSWYAAKAVEHGWSRSVLVHQIESNLYLRQGQAPTNFDRTLTSPLSELAQQTLKDVTCRRRVCVPVDGSPAGEAARKSPLD